MKLLLCVWLAVAVLVGYHLGRWQAREASEEKYIEQFMQDHAEAWQE